MLQCPSDDIIIGPYLQVHILGTPLQSLRRYLLEEPVYHYCMRSQSQDYIFSWQSRYQDYFLLQTPDFLSIEEYLHLVFDHIVFVIIPANHS